MAHDPTGAIAGGFIGIWLVFAILGVLATIFWIVEIVDVLRRQFPDSTLKIVWLLVVVFLHLLGALLYYFIGKRQGQLTT